MLTGGFSQFSGINEISYHGAGLLKTSGISADSAIIANTLNGVASMIGATLAVMIVLGFCLTTFFRVLVGLSAQFVPDELGGKPHLILVFVELFVFSMQAFIAPPS